MGWIILLVIVVLLVVVVGSVVGIYNRFVQQRQLVHSSWQQIDVELQRRHDLVPNLVETVKGAADFEQSTLLKVVEARQAAINTPAGDLTARAQAEDGLAGALKNVFALAENYPQLTATQNYRDLQQQLTETEDRIAAGRRFYNNNVQEYDTRLQTFPSSIIGNSFGFKPAEYFKVADASVREVPQVNFGNTNPTPPAPGAPTA